MNSQFAATSVVNAVMPKAQLGEPSEGEHPPELVERSPELRDLVALLNGLQEALAGKLQGDRPEAPSAARAPSLSARLRLDPFRVQLALRGGIAVCAAFVVARAIGWDLNPLVAPVTFMVAATPTRGGVVLTAVGVASAVLVGWLISLCAHAAGTRAPPASKITPVSTPTLVFRLLGLRSTST